MFLPAEQGGRCRVSDDGFLEGVPELVVEIAASSVSFDAHDKRDMYERHGVPEYLLWRTEDREVDWFCLADGRYQALTAAQDGLVYSTVFTNLALDIPALLSGDLKTVLSRLSG